MLHTFHSLSSIQENSDIILNQNNYNIFDSRMFKSDLNIEDTFKQIVFEFNRIWLNTIKPFIDAMMYNHNIYTVNPKKNIHLIPEEGIYLNLQGLSIDNIKYFYAIKGIRLIGIESTGEPNNAISVFNSPVYDPLAKSYYSAITIILYKDLLINAKSDNTILNRVLLRIINMVALSFIDDALMTKHNVAMNRIFASNMIDSNKDVIILPESLNISDARFIFNYFYALFNILSGLLNSEYLDDFSDYSSIISLPDIFQFDMSDEEAKIAEEKIKSMTDQEAQLYALGFKQKIYRQIWNFGKKYSNSSEIPDSDYIDICSQILRLIDVDLDTTYYDAETAAAEEGINDIEDDDICIKASTNEQSDL